MKNQFHRILLPVFLVLGACMPSQTPEMPSRAIGDLGSELPPMRVFAAPQPENFPISNSDLVRDFIDLSFELESGRSLPVFTRFEGPVTDAGLLLDADRLAGTVKLSAGKKRHALVRIAG